MSIHSSVISLFYFPACCVQSVMPEDALVGAWTKSAHKLWVKRLRRTSSLAELLQVLFCFLFDIFIK